MQGTLVSFSPKMHNNAHDRWNDLWKFVVKINVNGQEFTGEAKSQLDSGSKYWKIGALHEFEKTESQYAQGGYSFKGLKVLESPGTTTSSSKTSSAFDIQKESYVISRFAHQFALDYYKSLSTEQRDKLIEDVGKELVSGIAAKIAQQVFNVAKEVQSSYESQNRQAS